MSPPARAPHWTFLTHHGHVLLAVARDPDSRVHELAGAVGISSRATISILNDLEAAGYIQRARRGRTTVYAVQPHRPFRHPAEAPHEVDELVAIFVPSRA